MTMRQKRRSPRKAGNVAQAGGLSAWEVYRTEALAGINDASEKLSRFADETDNPLAGAVEAADLLDAAREALGGGV